MTLPLFLGILSSLVLLSTYALTKRNRAESYALRAFHKKDEAHIEEELMIHTALEEAGALPNHHHHHHGDKHKNPKSHPINIIIVFNFLGYIIIAIELFYLYHMILEMI
jgi:hypothetical protein